jgi:ferritin-like protein
MNEYHEPYEDLPPAFRDQHRALRSLQEEVEAVDWYRQRSALCDDPELKTVFEHNAREEVEHASMLLEWLRRHAPEWDTLLRRYLFSDGEITAVEPSSGREQPASMPTHRSLFIRSLKGE